jgi:hypothetical protein
MPTRFQRLVAFAVAIALCAASAPALTVAQDEPTTAQRPTTALASETVIVWDTFEDPATSTLPEDPGDDENFRYEYDDDQYEMDAYAEDFTGDLVVPVSGTFSDATLAIDAQLTGDASEEPGRHIVVNCRFSEEDSSGYQLEFRPLTATVILWRWDPDADRPNRLDTTELNDGEPMVGEPHRLELSCVGDQILGRMDGGTVVQATDDTYQEGSFAIGGGVYSGSPGPLRIDFDNLAISVPSELAEATDAPADAEEAAEAEEAVTRDRSALIAPAAELVAEATANEAAFGPEGGEIAQVVGGELNQVLAGVNLRDFVTEATFTVPEGEAADRWDVGFGFRQTANGQHWRIIVRSDGTWNLAVSAEYPRATGIVDNLSRGEGETNTLQLAVSGSTGHLIVNDAFTSTFDLSAWNEAGDIWVGSGFFLDDATDGAVTPFSEFTIWSLATTSPTGQIVVTPAPAAGGAQATEAPEEAETPEATPAEEEVDEPEVEPTPTPAEEITEPVEEATPAPEEDVTEAAEDATPAPEETEEVTEPVEEATPAVEEEPEATEEETPDATPEPEAAPELSMEEIQEQVADTEPTFGPIAGSVDQLIGSMDVEMAGVSVQDFYTSVRFSNPASPDDPEHPWDVVIGFWHLGGDDQVRLIISSDGTWSIALGTARPFQTGTASGLVLGPARGNVIDFAVVGTTGYLQINGEDAGTIEIPATPIEGDIWIASGSFPENVQEGVPTPFSAWSVWNLNE